MEWIFLIGIGETSPLYLKGKTSDWVHNHIGLAPSSSAQTNIIQIIMFMLDIGWWLMSLLFMDNHYLQISESKGPFQSRVEYMAVVNKYVIKSTSKIY